MITQINQQKVLRTGDFIIDMETQKEGKVHYLFQKDGQSTFEAKAKDIQSLQLDTGTQIKTLLIEKVGISKRRNK